MSDRYAWIHQPITQDLIAHLELSKKGLLEYIGNGGTMQDSADLTAMATANVHGRIKVIEEALDWILHFVEEKEVDDIVGETQEDYADGA